MFFHLPHHYFARRLSANLNILKYCDMIFLSYRSPLVHFQGNLRCTLRTKDTVCVFEAKANCYKLPKQAQRCTACAAVISSTWAVCIMFTFWPKQKAMEVRDTVWGREAQIPTRPSPMIRKRRKTSAINIWRPLCDFVVFPQTRRGDL